MHPRPAIAALALSAAAVVTLGTFARAAADDGSEVPPAAAPAAEGASPAGDSPRRLDTEAGMTSEINAVGTRHTSAGAVVTNPHAEAAYGVEVVFTLKDTAGGVVDTAREIVNYLPGHSSRIVAPLQIGFDLPVDATILEVDANVAEFAADVGPSGGGDAFRRPEGARLEVVGSTLVDEEYVSKVTGQVLNLTADVAQFSSLHCVLLADERIVGGTSRGLSAPVTPGTAATFESLLAFAPDGVDDVDCEVYASPLR